MFQLAPLPLALRQDLLRCAPQRPDDFCHASRGWSIGKYRPAAAIDQRSRLQRPQKRPWRLLSPPQKVSRGWSCHGGGRVTGVPRGDTLKLEMIRLVAILIHIAPRAARPRRRSIHSTRWWLHTLAHFAFIRLDDKSTVHNSCVRLVKRKLTPIASEDFASFRRNPGIRVPKMYRAVILPIQQILLGLQWLLGKAHVIEDDAIETHLVVGF